MNDERYYCGDCFIPVEYLPELDSYSCGRCELVKKRDELLSEQEMFRASELCRDIRQRSEREVNRI